MPRQRTELTKSGKQIGARLAKRHWEVWQKLGGVRWLREQLDKAIEHDDQVQRPR